MKSTIPCISTLSQGSDYNATPFIIFESVTVREIVISMPRDACGDNKMWVTQVKCETWQVWKSHTWRLSLTSVPVLIHLMEITLILDYYWTSLHIDTHTDRTSEHTVFCVIAYFCDIQTQRWYTFVLVISCTWSLWHTRTQNPLKLFW